MKKILFTMALGIVQALASPINISNTGSVVSLGVDQNWTIDGTTAYVTDTGGFPFGAWAADNAVSSFISPQPSYTAYQSDAGDTVFDFTTTFNLSSYNLAAAFLQFRLMADNSVDAVLLNGHNVGFSYLAPPSGSTFNVWSPTYNIGEYFQAGQNTLEFQVYNASGTVGNPTGLRVEFGNSFNGVPEPGTFAPLAGGLGVIAVFLRRKRHPAA